LVVSGSHFGGGASSEDLGRIGGLLALAKHIPPGWGFFVRRPSYRLSTRLSQTPPHSVGVDLTTPAGTWARPWQPPPHFGGGLSLSSGQLAPPRWGSVDQGQFPHPTEVGVCQFAVNSCTPPPWESVCHCPGLLAPPLWESVALAQVFLPHFGGSFSDSSRLSHPVGVCLYTNQPTPWESVQELTRHRGSFSPWLS
jgi:hypothetical protein